MIVRILFWRLDGSGDADELRDALPELQPPSLWLWNEASERFGAVIVGDDDEATAVGDARALIGREPDLYEEFDAF